ncbi:hypothetical protein [Holdemania sp. Marseille-P2844]|uniref:hypothetical protein n=1 Tax=Holdemania sp. Marseille-P2844 TaxID=1852366 RepID=UPI00135660AB|nr:hypothetical protein [Holdemania sp. Marseille-P2844]
MGRENNAQADENNEDFMTKLCKSTPKRLLKHKKNLGYKCEIAFIFQRLWGLPHPEREQRFASFPV